MVRNRKTKIIKCACGCGEEFNMYDSRNRIRKIINNHCKNHFWLGKKRPEMENSKNINWKENDVSYRSLHKWVQRRLGKPMCCDFCGDTSIHRYHWANTDGKYQRNIIDWIRLCPKCHGGYDKARRSK